MIRFALLVVGLLGLSIGSISGQIRIARICAGEDGSLSIFTRAWKDSCGNVSVEVIGKESAVSAFKSVASFSGYRSEYRLPGLRSKFINGSFFLKVSAQCGSDFLSDTAKVDVDPPSILELESVSSPGPSGQIKHVLKWPLSPAPDIMGYVIYETEGNVNLPIDTLLGQWSSYTRDVADSSAKTYRISPFDSCGNRAALGKKHSTIFGKYLGQSCDRVVKIGWELYEGWPVDSYVVYGYYLPKKEVFRLGNGGTQTSTKVQLPIDIDQPVWVYVVGYKQGDPSVATRSSEFEILPQRITFPVPSLYTVTSTDQGIVLKFSVQEDQSAERLEIWRGKLRGDLEKIAEIDPIPFGEWLDGSADLHQLYHYQIRAVDTCFGRPSLTDTLNNVVLKMKDEGGKRVLNYSMYRWLFGDTTTYYIVYRSLDGGRTYDSIYGGFDLGFVDMGNTDDLTLGKVCYRVSAFPKNIRLESLRSESNSVCITRPPIIHVPNAVVIGGVNDTFMPVGQFIDYSASRMEIFDRWGEMIFHTNDLRFGWNLRRNDEFVPEGVYLYRIMVVGEDLSTLYRNGTFSVLK